MKKALVLWVLVLGFLNLKAQFRKERSNWGQIKLGTAEVLGVEALSSLVL